MKRISVSLPPDLFRKAERLAKKQRQSTAEFFREAIHVYLAERRRHDGRRSGARRVRQRDIVDARIAEGLRT